MKPLKLTNILLLAGIILFFIGFASFAIPLFAIWLLIRLFAPTDISVFQIEYSYWRHMIIAGMIAWPFVIGFFFFFSIMAMGGPNADPKPLELSALMILLALPISIISLFAATYFREHSRMNAALYALKAPFFYF